jgi:hypothetical protein
MTTHRDLKRLARERAARTGESYTTARRHVLARAGHTGEPYSETTLCGLAGGIGFLYAVFEYRDLPPIVTIVAQHHPAPWAPAALGRLSIPFEERHSTSARAAEDDLRALLAGARPVHCVVDRGGLPWHPAKTLATDPYPVVVAGRRDHHYLLDDEAARPRELVAGDFVAAWTAHRKGRHQRLVVGSPAGTVDLAAAMRDAITTTVAHLTGPVLGNAAVHRTRRHPPAVRGLPRRGGRSPRRGTPGPGSCAVPGRRDGVVGGGRPGDPSRRTGR